MKKKMWTPLVKPSVSLFPLLTRLSVLLVVMGMLAGSLLVIRPAQAHAQASQQSASTVQTATPSGKRLDVFIRGSDLALWHRYFDTDTGKWSDWHRLGGHLDTSPSATIDPDNSAVLDVFYINNGDVYRVYLDKQTVGGDGDHIISWDNLGGPSCQASWWGFCSPPLLTSSLAVTSVVGRPGRLDMFAFEGADQYNEHELWHRWYTTDDGWHDWEKLSVADFTGDPAAFTWPGDDMEVLVHGSDGNAVEIKGFQFHSGRWSGGWGDLGGQIYYSPAVTAWANGRADVFVIGRDLQIWHKWYDNGYWSGTGTGGDGWEPLGGRFTSSPAAASWGPGRLDVFAQGTDNQIWHKWYDNGQWSGAGTKWDGWESLGGGDVASAPAAIAW